MTANFRLTVEFPRPEDHPEQGGQVYLMPLAGGVTMVQFRGSINYTPDELRLIADTLRLAADHSEETPNA